MKNEEAIERFYTIVQIIQRAEAMGIGQGTRTTKILDMENADKQFALRLDDFLAADDSDFRHDFIGIQCNMNRETGRIDNLFVPRFSGNGRHTRSDDLTFVAQTMTKMVNSFVKEPITITYRNETEESVNDYTAWGRERFGILPSSECFYICRGELLYVVHVEADSILTAASELMSLIARKF